MCGPAGRRMRRPEQQIWMDAQTLAWLEREMWLL